MTSKFWLDASYCILYLSGCQTLCIPLNILQYFAKQLLRNALIFWALPLSFVREFSQGLYSPYYFKQETKFSKKYSMIYEVFYFVYWDQTLFLILCDLWTLSPPILAYLCHSPNPSSDPCQALGSFLKYVHSLVISWTPEGFLCRPRVSLSV